MWRLNSVLLESVWNLVDFRSTLLFRLTPMQSIDEIEWWKLIRNLEQIKMHMKLCFPNLFMENVRILCKLCFINFLAHKPILWGYCYPCFGLPGLAALLTLGRSVCVTYFLRFTSGARPADLLVISMESKPISSFYLRAGIGGARNRDINFTAECSIFIVHIIQNIFLHNINSFTGSNTSINVVSTFHIL